MVFQLSQKSLARLIGIHPDLVRVVKLGLTMSPHDFAVSEGLRSLERQRELVAKGASMTLKSKHLRQIDGWAHAVDLVAVGDLDHDGDVDAQDVGLVWEPKVYTDIAVAMKRAAVESGVRVRWGGEFKARDGRPWFDGPHWEIVL